MFMARAQIVVEAAKPGPIRASSDDLSSIIAVCGKKAGPPSPDPPPEPVYQIVGEANAYGSAGYMASPGLSRLWRVARAKVYRHRGAGD
jgi:hypothetical protein